MNVIEQYQAYLVSRNKFPKTIRGYDADLRQFQKLGAGEMISKRLFGNQKS
jgi:hypothetical protein